MCKNELRHWWRKREDIIEHPEIISDFDTEELVIKRELGDLLKGLPRRDVVSILKRLED